MDTTTIRNFTQTERLNIFGTDHNNRPGKLVSLAIYEGALSLQFSMTPEQAREMAAALIAHADALEAA
jgi:hypothetical protein